MSQKKVQVVKAVSLANFFSAQPTKGIVVTFTPKDFAFAPLKPRLVCGEFGRSVQIVQYVNGSWRQIGIRLHNIDHLVAAVAAIAKMLSTAVEMGYVDEEEIPTETLQIVKGYLQDALIEIEKAIEARKKERSS